MVMIFTIASVRNWAHCSSGSKYRADRSSRTGNHRYGGRIFETKLNDGIRKFDLIIPVPPSAVRAVQPVLLLANGIGEVLGVTVDDCITPRRPTRNSKKFPIRRNGKKCWMGFTKVDPVHTENKNILLFDDLFRSARR